jgi:cell division protein FtsI/penicillin-binding protein 2
VGNAARLGERSGIDLPNEVQGLVLSPEWKQQYRKEKCASGETVSVSIGRIGLGHAGVDGGLRGDAG